MATIKTEPQWKEPCKHSICKSCKGYTRKQIQLIFT